MVYSPMNGSPTIRVMVYAQFEGYPKLKVNPFTLVLFDSQKHDKE